MTQREIKFRAWDKKEDKMIFPESDWIIANGSMQLFKSLGSHLIIMQFTGLKDKNGKEIYEGDILGKKNPDWLKGHSGKYEVKWNEEIEDEYNCYVGYRKPEREFEVIGNIYKNPELLK